MVNEILIGILIISLLGYIIYLHIMLARKNIFIENTIKRLSGNEKKWSSSEIIEFVNRIRETGNYRLLFNDKLFEERPLDFLFGNNKGTKIFIHYTRDEGDARNIIKEGFRFADSFYKTALRISNDKLDLLVKHNSRKSFGDYLIVLCLANRITEHYASELEKKGLLNYSVENVLTEASSYRDENSDYVYILSKRFVKGFINHRTGEVVRNPDFNPLYDSPQFRENLENLASRALNNTKI